MEPTGYDQESAHFKSIDAKALSQLRAAADARRAEQSAAAAKDAHWMRCPKCGTALKEIRQDEVVIDHCSGCHGVFLDAGELELLVAQARTKQGFLAKLLGR